MDHLRNSLNIVAGMIFWWLCGWGTHSYPAGRRHRRDTDPSFSGSKTIVAVWTLFGGGKVFGKEVVGRSGKN